MLREKTCQYIECFNHKDLSGVAALLDENFALEDPAVKRIEGKMKCLEAIKNIFNSCENLKFYAKNIYLQDSTTLIEFVLMLDEMKLEGVDIIEWKEGKIQELRAYLDMPKE
ncbi:nuclear transport factor 2 family protein [Helicobacter sp.]|uniref:nuclear transport factor 2 family protein n=1 Tax=Helicobacter sp. TaxID=218 RepID=UPI0019CD0BAE|nr:nuclear transport factor 2 family protein [Helicobacter sp.]MBD5164978.1 nuclear transport factor 2 family protein [Helicobacter sp.]